MVDNLCELCKNPIEPQRLFCDVCLSKSQRDKTFKWRLFVIKEQIDERKESNNKGSISLKKRWKEKKEEMFELIFGSKK